MKRGCFITFEGPDGSGKSTQMERLEQFLTERNLPILRSREPGGTEISEALRQLILDPSRTEMNSRTEALLYAAARAQHVEEVIRPALDQGITVICDRFTDSSIVYQGYGRELGAVSIRRLNAFATGGLQPDLTILMAIDPELGRKRAAQRNAPDRIEAEALSFHRRVYQGYLEIAEQEPERIICIDAEAAVDSIAAKIQKRVAVFLEARNE